MTTLALIAVTFGVPTLVGLAICSMGKRADTYSLTALGERAAAQLGDAHVVDTFDAHEQVYVRATRHPSGFIDIRVYDPAIVADVLGQEAEDAMKGAVA